MMASSIALPSSVNDLDIFVSLLHARGINVRHLGRVRQHLRTLCLELARPEMLLPPICVNSKKALRWLHRVGQAWQVWCLIEMISRVLKNELRALFRKAMAEQRALAEEPFRVAAVALINDRLGSNGRADAFWCASISL
jgi:hypothetical protein